MICRKRLNNGCRIRHKRWMYMTKEPIGCFHIVASFYICIATVSQNWGEQIGISETVSSFV